MDEVIIELDVSWVSKAVFQLLIKLAPSLLAHRACSGWMHLLVALHGHRSCSHLSTPCKPAAATTSLGKLAQRCGCLQT